MKRLKVAVCGSTYREYRYRVTKNRIVEQVTDSIVRNWLSIHDLSNFTEADVLRVFIIDSAGSLGTFFGYEYTQQYVMEAS